MNRKLFLSTALVAGILPLASVAQVSPAPPAAPAAAQAAPVTPEAIPAKIGLIAFEQAVVSTNEGQRSIEEVNKKYEPKQKQLSDLNTEIDSLKKQLDSAPATMSADEKATRARTIDTKSKQLQRDMEDAETSYRSDQQEALGKVAQKVNVVMQNYAKQTGFTLVIDYSNQQTGVMFAEPKTDITEAVINAYNASTPSITAPPPAAPSAARPASPRPAPSTAPKTTTPPKPQK